MNWRQNPGKEEKLAHRVSSQLADSPRKTPAPENLGEITQVAVNRMVRLACRQNWERNGNSKLQTAPKIALRDHKSSSPGQFAYHLKTRIGEMFGAQCADWRRPFLTVRLTLYTVARRQQTDAALRTCHSSTDLCFRPKWLYDNGEKLLQLGIRFRVRRYVLATVHQLCTNGLF